MAVESKECFVRVTTFNPQTNKEETVKAINYGNHEERVWLSTHMMWALNSGKAIQLLPLKVEDGST